jgi:uncharacterized membrane protein
MESIHPLVVHFPIALLLSALFIDVLALRLKRSALHSVALWNLTLGVLGSAAAVLTGLQAEDVAKHSFEIWKIIELHKRLGIATLIIGVVVAAWRLWKRDQLTLFARILTIAAMSIMAATVGFGAYLGGRLVYEFGVGRI